MDRNDIGNKVERVHFTIIKYNFYTEVDRNDIGNKVEREYISPSSSTLYMWVYMYITLNVIINFSEYTCMYIFREYTCS